MVSTAISFALAFAFVAVLLAVTLAVPTAVSFAVFEAFPRHAIEPRAGQGWLDVIFANRYIVFSGRVFLISLTVVLIVGGLYVTASVLYRIYRQEFLYKVGWFEADVVKMTDRELAEIRASYDSALNDAWEHGEEVEARLTATAQALEEASDGIAGLAEENARLAAEVEHWHNQARS